MNTFSQVNCRFGWNSNASKVQKEKILKANWEDSKIQGETFMNKEDFLENTID